jgi:hypothetical protein
MNRAKLSALQRLLNIRSGARFCIPPLHYFMLLYYKISIFLHDPKKRSGKIQESIIWVEFWGDTYMMDVLTLLVNFLGLAIAAVFLALWVTIFVQELTAYNQNCSDWNDSTCQGSEVYCNDLDLRQQCPSL